MPKAQILPNAQTGQISGQFKGEFSGNIWLGKNIDLERSKGRVGLSDSYSHLQHSGQAGFSSLTTSIAFVRSSADNTDRWWANAGVLFKTTGTNPKVGWAQDAIASSPTAPLYDLIDFAGNLVCPISTDLSRLVAGVWTSAWWTSLSGASALQALPHRFAIFEGALCFTDGRFINDYDGTIARDPAISLPVGFEARWLLPWRDLLFIGGANTVGQQAEVFTWRRSLSNFEGRFPIGDSEALCGFVIDVPYIVTLKGAIKKFTGTGFETVQGFPSVELGFNLNGIHPNGVAVTENIAKLLVDMGVSNSMRRLSGIYNFDATTKNLYHAGGVRNTAGSDYTQLEVAGYGAIKATVPGQGAYLIGAQPYTIYSGTTRYGIFSSDEENTNNRGYMITPKIPASDVRAYFKYLTAKFQRFDNAGDRVKLLYRVENSLTLPTYETITWVAANQFTGSDANAVVGDFVEIIAGDNAGAIARISAKSASAPFTFTINISLNSSTNAARARYLRFNEIDTISSQSIQEDRAPIADRGNWIQFLIDFIGSETSPQLEKILLEWKDIPV